MQSFKAAYGQNLGLQLLTHAIKHVVNAQPSDLSQVSREDEITLAILMDLKESIRLEKRIAMYKGGDFSLV
jgi:hypothetical protein